MAEKMLHTRIQLRYDTYANWMASTVILKAGEVAIATIPTGTADSGSAHLPAVLMKVGDGAHAFKDLDWVQGVAADVHDWAKAADKPEYTAEEIDGLADFIDDTIKDTNTKYKLAFAGFNPETLNDTYKLQYQELGSTVWNDVQDSMIFEIPTMDVSNLKELVGEDSVEDQIAAAITALDLANTYYSKSLGEANATAISGLEGRMTTAEGNISDNADAIDDINELIGNTSIGEEGATITGAISALQEAIGESGSVAKQISDAIDAYDEETVQPINTRLGTAEGDIDALEGRMDDAEGDIDALEGRMDTAESDIADLKADKQDNIAWQSDNYDKDSNKAITKSDLDAAVAGLTGAVHFRGVVASTDDVENPASGDIVIVGVKEYVYDGSKWNELGDETIYAVKGNIVDADIAANAAIEQSKIAGLGDALDAKYDVSEAEKLEGRVEAIEGLIGDDSVADQIDAAKAELIGNEGDAATADTIYGAKAAAAAVAADNEALEGRVAAIEKDYLKQADKTELNEKIDALTTDDIAAGVEEWIFNCGGASAYVAPAADENA